MPACTQARLLDRLTLISCCAHGARRGRWGTDTVFPALYTSTTRRLQYCVLFVGCIARVAPVSVSPLLALSEAAYATVLILLVSTASFDVRRPSRWSSAYVRASLTETLTRVRVLEHSFTLTQVCQNIVRSLSLWTLTRGGAVLSRLSLTDTVILSHESEC